MTMLDTDTFTVGADILVAPTKVNDFRANWSRNNGTHSTSLTNFHGSQIRPYLYAISVRVPIQPGEGTGLGVLLR